MDVTQVVLGPVVSEKSYGGTADGLYTFRVHKDAHKTQVRQAVEQLFEVKVNRKARRAALRGALSHHAANGTLALVDGSAFDVPSTRSAHQLLSGWSERPTVVVVTDDEETLAKSFRNLDDVLVTAPSELEVATVVWARSVLVSEAALPLVLARAGAGAAQEEGAE